MTPTTPNADALAAADRLAATLSDPVHTLGRKPPVNGRTWPQSLAGGAAGIALLHTERARAGRGEWALAHRWLAEAARQQVSAAPNANLFFGAPALAYVTHLAHRGSGRYRRLLARLDEAALAVTQTRLAAAHARIDRADRPLMAEFDLIRGLSGLGAYHLSRHPDHPVTRSVLSYLVRLATSPSNHGRPPWWTSVAPNGEPSTAFPHGHGNLGLSHGIGAALSILSLARTCGQDVPGTPEALARICAWTDQWRQGDATSPWWPGLLSTDQLAAGSIDAAQRPRPSWCYGASGTARAQQLAGLALNDAARVRTAENALLAALGDPQQLAALPQIGLCHGIAGLLQSTWRMADHTGNQALADHLPHLTDRLLSALAAPEQPDPELLDGAAGAALALHTVGTGHAPAPHWDAFLALA